MAAATERLQAVPFWNRERDMEAELRAERKLLFMEMAEQQRLSNGRLYTRPEFERTLQQATDKRRAAAATLGKESRR
jgi:hypothetical protein